MADSFFRVKHASIFVAGKKVATVVTSTISLHSGAERQFGPEGFLGYSDGPITTTCEVTEIVPINFYDTTFNPETAILGALDLDMSFGLLGGTIWQVRMRCTERSFQSDARSGKLTGHMVFGGGEPKIVVGQ